MKTLLAALLLFAACTARADDILAAGTYYYKATITYISADWVTIKHRDGEVTIPWSNLSTSAQRQYAQEHEAAIAKENASATGTIQVSGHVISRSPTGGLLLATGTNEAKEIFVRGLPNEKNLVDHDFVRSIWVVSDGTYGFTAANGAYVTVRAYRVPAAQ